MEIINYECYVSLEVAKLLKEVGFDLEIDSLYRVYPEEPVKFEVDSKLQYNWNIHSNVISAPTLDVAQRWLREVKNIDVNILAESISGNKKYVVLGIWFNILDVNASPVVLDTVRYKSYEEAQEAGIKKALELILKKGE